MKKINLLIGVFFIALGAILMLHNPLGMTGYAVSGAGGEKRMYFAGIFLIIFGGLVLISSRTRKMEEKAGKSARKTKKASR